MFLFGPKICMCRPAQSPARSAWAGRAAARGQGPAGAAQQRDCYVSRLYECVCVRAAFTVLSSTFKFIYAYAEYLMKI